MLTAIEFDNQPRVVTHKVDDIRTDRSLSSKGHSSEPVCS